MDVNAQVAAGQPILRLEETGAEEAGDADGVEFFHLVTPGGVTDGAALECRLLGYDAPAEAPSDAAQAKLDEELDEEDAPQLAQAVHRHRGGHRADALRGRFRWRRCPGADALNRVLPAPQRASELVPEDWHAELVKVLRRLGVDDVKDPDAFADGLHRLMRAGSALPRLEPAVSGVLRRWLTSGGPGLAERLDLDRIERVAIVCEEPCTRW